MIAYNHNKFRDVIMVVVKKFTLPHKVKLKVMWWSKDGKRFFGRENIVLTKEKWAEFERVSI